MAPYRLESRAKETRIRPAVRDCRYCGRAFAVPRLYPARKGKWYGQWECGRECHKAMRKLQRNKGNFRPGHVSWNKGKKGIHISPATEFKKGQRAVNQLPLGTITIRIGHQNRHENITQWIKVAEPGTWQQLSNYIWELHHGSIPCGMVIVHKDRDSMNDDPENLILMTRAESINHHRKLLYANRIMPRKYDIPLELIKQVARKEITIKAAALIVGCSYMTMRARFLKQKERWRRGILN
jgi:hypothetical protein